MKQEMNAQSFIIAGKSWNGNMMHLIHKRNGDLEVVSDCSEIEPLIFSRKESAELILPEARRLATACDLNVVEYLSENDFDHSAIHINPNAEVKQ